MKENIIIGLLIAVFTLYICYIGAKTSDERIDNYIQEIDRLIDEQEE